MEKSQSNKSNVFEYWKMINDNSKWYTVGLILAIYAIDIFASNFAVKGIMMFAALIPVMVCILAKDIFSFFSVSLPISREQLMNFHFKSCTIASAVCLMIVIITAIATDDYGVLALLSALGIIICHGLAATAPFNRSVAMETLAVYFLVLLNVNNIFLEELNFGITLFVGFILIAGVVDMMVWRHMIRRYVG